MAKTPVKRIAFVAVPIVAIAVGLVVVSHARHGTQQNVKRAAQQFAAAVSDHKVDALSYANTKPADVLAQYKTAVGNMSATPVTATVGKVKLSGSTATAVLDYKWSFGKGDWTYNTTLNLLKTSGKWQPDWKPSSIQPALTTANSLSVARVQPKRADILGANGQTLVTESPVVDVGVSPQRVTDVDGLSKQLASLLQVDAASLAAQIRAAKPTAFVDVVTLRQSDYDSLKAKLQPLPGTVFKQGTLPLAPTRQFASALLGRVGPVTADIVKASNGRLQTNDVAGLSGLQLQYDPQLAGTTGITVSLVPQNVNDASQQLYKIDPVVGKAVTTTLDTKAQEAADDALAGQAKPSSLIAIQASTGAVLADANGPDVGGADRALVGQYPPGSSFKVVTTYSLLQHGVNASDTVACPPTITVGGRTFKNAENEAFGSAPFNVDFAKSCNTAFISLAPKVPGADLPDAASAFGLGAKWNSGVSVFSGSVPKPTTDVELAATAFGQGSTLVSPLAMANVAAGVDSGSAHTPSIVTDPAPSGAGAPTPLNSATVDTLRTLMRQVVTSGTGTAVAKVAGGDVYGKTGTAEFGNDNPPKAHAWFIGYQGDIAFAVLVEGGEFGGDTAAPIAAKFLTSMSS